MIDWIRTSTLDAMVSWLIKGGLLSDAKRLIARFHETIAERAGVE